MISTCTRTDNKLRYNIKYALKNAPDLNVEQEKAVALNNKYSIQIAEEMIEFSENSEIVSNIGNM